MRVGVRERNDNGWRNAPEEARAKKYNSSGRRAGKNGAEGFL